MSRFAFSSPYGALLAACSVVFAGLTTVVSDFFAEGLEKPREEQSAFIHLSVQQDFQRGYHCQLQPATVDRNVLI